MLRVTHQPSETPNLLRPQRGRKRNGPPLPSSCLIMRSTSFGKSHSDDACEDRREPNERKRLLRTEDAGNIRRTPAIHWRDRRDRRQPGQDQLGADGANVNPYPLASRSEGPFSTGIVFSRDCGADSGARSGSAARWPRRWLHAIGPTQRNELTDHRVFCGLDLLVVVLDLFLR